MDVLECFKVKETGKVYCFISANDGTLYVQEVKFYETSKHELPEDVRKIIEG